MTMEPGKPGRGADQFPLRLPDGMRDRLKQAAAENNRSMNAEIVARLSTEGPDVSATDIDATMKAIDDVDASVRSMLGDPALQEKMRRAKLFEAMSRLLDLRVALRTIRSKWEFANDPRLQAEFIDAASYAAYVNFQMRAEESAQRRAKKT